MGFAGGTALSAPPMPRLVPLIHFHALFLVGSLLATPLAAARPAPGGAPEEREPSPVEPPFEAPDAGAEVAVSEEESDGGGAAAADRREPRAAAPEQLPAASQGGAIPPELLQGTPPVFPRRALEVGLVEGHVTLKVRVGVDGRVEATEIVEGAGNGFDEAALETATHYQFSPAVIGGRPVAAYILVRVDFRAPPSTATTPMAAAVEAKPEPTPESTLRAAEPNRISELPVEVTIQGQSEADRLRRSAEAVNVVETQVAKRHSQDLGEVLARTQGVGVQRSSGLGSDTRLSLNGLTDDQVRFFLDGVPLDFTGYPVGIANIPVNLVKRIEVYRGVVPVRFGADALGGAINLVSESDVEEGVHGSASLQTGSFGTYRATTNGSYYDWTDRWFANVAAFLDLAENDYPMNVVVPDDSGREVEARVYRFHDGYRAFGANAEAGVLDRVWAKRFSIKGFVSDYDKDVQHNLIMTFNPYGDVEYGQFSAGATANYEQVIGARIFAKVVAGYAYRHLTYLDVGECHYDWFGQCFRERAQPGESIGRAQDQDYWEHNVYGRVNLEWRVDSDHAFHLSMSPTYTERRGRENRLANPDARDPLSAERRMGGLVSGLEHQLDLLDGDLENRVFVKDYLQFLRSEDPLSNGVDFRREDRTTHRAGVGDGARYSLLDWLYVKASYEWATRLPRPDEVFGNAFPVQPNLALEPEKSHNFNVGLTVDSLRTQAGEWRGDVNGFLREVHDLVRLVGDDEAASYQNVRDARSLGAETAVGWTSVGRYVALDGNATYVDFRNTSKDGADATYAGDRIPNRPYLFATGSARLSVSQVGVPRDELSLTWTSRYVHSFFRGWESIGTDKPVVPEQLLHSLALLYALDGEPMDLSFSSEIQNLTDAEAYDYFGVPKPGRAFYFKMTTSL